METQELEDLRDTVPLRSLGDFCEKMLQSVCLHYGLLEDQGCSICMSSDSSPGESIPNAMTLRDMRRTGHLAELDREAQSTLLGGSLYQYHNSAAPMPPAGTRRAAALSATVSRGSQQSPNRDAAGNPLADTGGSVCSRVPLASTSTEILALRSSINRILQVPDVSDGDQQDQIHLQQRTTLEELDCELTPDAALPDDTVDEATILAANLEDSNEVSPVQSVNVSRLSDEPGARFSSAFRSGGELPSFVQFDDEAVTTEHLGTSVMDELGDTTFSLEQLEQTLLGGTVSPEGGLDGGLIVVLRRIAAGASLDESLLRTVQRVLQLGTLLSGHRLSDEEIQNLPKVRFEETEEQSCAICLEAYEQGELLTALPCGHFFHIECLARWLQRASQCPLCRAEA